MPKAEFLDCFPQTSIHPFRKRLLNTYYVPGHVLSTGLGGKKKKERQKSLSSETAELQWGRNKSLDDDSKIDADSDVPQETKAREPGPRSGRREEDAVPCQRVAGSEDPGDRAPNF